MKPMMNFKKQILLFLSTILVVNVCAQEAETEGKKSFSRCGYILRPEVGIGNSMFSDRIAPYASIDFGYQFGNPFFVGAGVEYTIAQVSRSTSYSTLPIYVSARISPVAKRPVTPIVDLKMGYNIGIGKREIYYLDYFKESPALWQFKETYTGERWQGLFLYASFGIQIRRVDVQWFWDHTGGLEKSHVYTSSTGKTSDTETHHLSYLGTGLKLAYNIRIKGRE